MPTTLPARDNQSRERICDQARCFSPPRACGNSRTVGVASWFGVFLPKATPASAVDELNRQIKAMPERDDVKKNIAGMGARANYGTPQQFSDFVGAETRKFAAIIEKERLQMEVK
jgi:tripartite-type tricarboxylate transporter receptor subunit TctC